MYKQTTSINWSSFNLLYEHNIESTESIHFGSSGKYNCLSKKTETGSMLHRFEKMNGACCTNSATVVVTSNLSSCWTPTYSETSRYFQYNIRVTLQQPATGQILHLCRLNLFKFGMVCWCRVPTERSSNYISRSNLLRQQSHCHVSHTIIGDMNDLSHGTTISGVTGYSIIFRIVLHASDIIFTATQTGRLK
jgi:hypothetical protein